ncbi:MAG: hypothetical protein QM630_02800 [Microbacterium sp.]
MNPVRLHGTDEEISLIASLARRAVDADPVLARDVLPGLAALRRARQQNTGATGTPARIPQVAASDSPRRVLGVLWSILCGLGVSSALAYAWVLAPPVRGFSFDVAIAQPILVISGLAALVLLVLALATDAAATPAQVGIAAVWSGIVAGIAVFVMVYRVAVGSSQGTALPTSALVLWFAGVAVLVAVLVVSTLRWRRRARADASRRGVSWQGNPSHRREIGRVLGVARDLARRRSSSDGVVREWERALEGLRAIDEETLAQARALGPVAWMVWTVYDGEIDISGLRLAR